MKSEETGYPCPFCPGKYKRKNGLERHVNGHHLSEFRFPCSHCDKGFARSDLFRRHMKRYHPKEPVIVPPFHRRTPEQIAKTHESWRSAKHASRASSSGASTEASGSGSAAGSASGSGSAVGVGSRANSHGSNAPSVLSQHRSAQPYDASTDKDADGEDDEEEDADMEEDEEGEGQQQQQQQQKDEGENVKIKSEPDDGHMSLALPPPHLTQQERSIYAQQQYAPSSPEPPSGSSEWSSPWTASATMASTSAAFLLADATVSQDAAWPERSALVSPQGLDSQYYHSAITPLQAQHGYFGGVTSNLGSQSTDIGSPTTGLGAIPTISPSESMNYPSPSKEFTNHHENY